MLLPLAELPEIGTFEVLPALVLPELPPLAPLPLPLVLPPFPPPFPPPPPPFRRAMSWYRLVISGIRILDERREMVGNLEMRGAFYAAMAQEVHCSALAMAAVLLEGWRCIGMWLWVGHGQSNKKLKCAPLWIV